MPHKQKQKQKQKQSVKQSVVVKVQPLKEAAAALNIAQVTKATD